MVKVYELQNLIFTLKLMSANWYGISPLYDVSQTKESTDPFLRYSEIARGTNARAVGVTKSGHPGQLLTLPIG
jgi:hypothetical protein